MRASSSAKMVQVGAKRVVVGRDIRRTVLLDVRANRNQATLERRINRGRVEHDVADLLPQVVLILTANDAHRALKGLATDPQLAVQREGRQARDEPVRGVKQIAQP